MPTPDSAYTPPSASPVTMNGLKSSKLGIGTVDASRSAATGLRTRDRRARLREFRIVLLDLADLRDRRIRLRYRDAAVLDHHLPALRRRGPVDVVRQMQRRVAVVPGPAEHVGLEPLQVLDRLVDGLDRVGVALDRLQRRDELLGHREAHLAERAQPAADLAAVLV